jgi:hypothetical protein
LAIETPFGSISAHVIVEETFYSANLILQTLGFDINSGGRTSDLFATYTRSGRTPGTVSSVGLRRLGRDCHEIGFSNGSSEPQISLFISGNIELKSIL